MRENRFKISLLSGKPQIGLWLGLADPYAAEICAGAGFDWLLIDGEHAPNDIRTVLAQLQAVSAYPSQAVVRPCTGEAHVIKQMLDIGAQTLLIPMVESADQAADLVKSVEYPPTGVRGVGSALARASRWNGIQGYLGNARENICLLAQLESVKALENLDEILTVTGIDGFFVGISDLAASLGYLGDAAAPAVQQTVRETMRKVLAAGKRAGTLTTNDALARSYLELGCTFVATGIDTMLLATTARELAARFK
jgi:4-hydroxy-2-oxoheptanedioate aldolase